MGGRILIADDEPDVLDSVACILKACGHEIVTAGSGEEALDRLASFSAEVVVTDLRMPRIDGIELIRRIKALDETIEVVVLTGYATLENAIDSLKRGGAYDFLSKPLEDNDLLVLCVDKALERKRLREQNKRLAEQVQETRKLEAITTLAGGIAHQFNNWLSVATGNMDLIGVDFSPSTGITQYTVPIQQSLDQMAELTAQLLAYARGGCYEPQSIRPDRFFSDTLRLLNHMIPQRIRLRQELAMSPHEIRIDPTQLQMALSAVLNNAVEAIDGEGQIEIRLQVMKVDKPKALPADSNVPCEYICLKVKDTGSGMDETTRSQIFEPFFTTKIKGRGLGLAAAYGILDNHGGWIDVASTPGEGSVFALFIPVHPPAEPEVETASPPFLHTNGVALLIEDEVAVNRAIRLMLEHIGFRVLVAETGKRALELAASQEGPIDLAVLDVHLSDLSGLTVYEELTLLKKEMKTLLVSGYAKDARAKDLMDRGAKAFLQKPISLEELKRVVSQVMAPGPNGKKQSAKSP